MNEAVDRKPRGFINDQGFLGPTLILERIGMG